MKNYELLEAIGSVDEDLLEECEATLPARKRPGLKIMLVAAIVVMLSITACVAVKKHLDYQPVTGGEVVPAPFLMIRSNGDFTIIWEESIWERSSPGVRITAEIDTVQDVPMKLLYPYLPVVPEDWACSDAGNAKYDGEIGMVGIEWTFQEDGKEYQVFYRQESASFYNKRVDHAVWWMDHLPEDVTVTGQATTIGDAPVYRVEVSGSKDRNFYTYDRSLIFWSDGYSIFQLDVPQYWEESRIFELMCSLTLQEDMEAALSKLD